MFMLLATYVTAIYADMNHILEICFDINFVFLYQSYESIDPVTGLGYNLK